MTNTKRKPRRTEDKLTMYRRHNGSCEFKNAKSDLCKCPLWAHGRLHGKRGRWALNTDALSVGENRMIAMLRHRPDDDPNGGGIHAVGAPSPDMSLAEGEARFVVDAKTRIQNNRLTETSLALYSATIRDFRGFAEAKGIERMRDVSEEFIATWLDANKSWSPRTVRSRVMFLSVWFGKAAEKKWIPVSPIAKRTGLVPVVPTFAREALQPSEITAVLTAIPQMVFRRKGRGVIAPAEAELRRARLRAAILLMLYSGLRISDVAFLERASIQNGVLDVVTIKNGERLRAPILLPQVVLDALAELPASRIYYFVPDRTDDYRDARLALATGNDFIGTIGSSFADMQCGHLSDLIKQVFTLAGIEGRAHRLRHTFAVNHLDGGGSMYDLRNMLGHSSVVITEKYLSLAKAYRKAQAPAVRYEFPAA